MRFSETQTRHVLSRYLAADDPDEAPDGERAEDYWTADELRLIDIFKVTFHMAAISRAAGQPWEGDVLEQNVAKIYNVRCADVRTALGVFTEQVPLEDWVSAACDKHNLYQLIPALEASSKQVMA